MLPGMWRTIAPSPPSKLGMLHTMEWLSISLINTNIHLDITIDTMEDKLQKDAGAELTWPKNNLPAVLEQ